MRYKEWTAQIINISDSGTSIEIAYPLTLNGYAEYQRKTLWVAFNAVEFVVCFPLCFVIVFFHCVLKL